LVIGVGTSCVTVAANLAFRLGANLTFMAFNPADRADPMNLKAHPEHPTPRYMEFERDPIVSPLGQGSILILDDIIATGNDADKAIARVLGIGKQFSLTPQHLIHISLFRLGTKSLRVIKGVRYFACCSIPDVYYAEDSRACGLEGTAVAEWEIPSIYQKLE
jgi:hypothetical protein